MPLGDAPGEESEKDHEYDQIGGDAEGALDDELVGREVGTREPVQEASGAFTTDPADTTRAALALGIAFTTFATHASGAPTTTGTR
jgi:hypothetical protein